MSDPQSRPQENSLANLRPAWQPGQSGNPTGKGRNPSIVRKLRNILERDSDMYEAARVIEASGQLPEQWDVEALTNADLLAMSMVGIALNRTQRIPAAVQLQAQIYITDRMDGKLTDKTPAAAVQDDENSRPIMTVEAFRAAVMMPAPSPDSADQSQPDEIDDI